MRSSVFPGDTDKRYVTSVCGDYSTWYGSSVQYRCTVLPVAVAADIHPDGLSAAMMGGLTALAGAFHAAHERTYGHKNEAEPVHLVTLRLSATGNLGEPRFTEGTGTGESLKGARPAWFPATGRVDTPVHERARLAVGQEIAGPAIVESLDSTLVIPPAWQGAVDAAGFIRLTRR